MQEGFATGKKVFELLDQQLEIIEKNKAKKLLIKKGKVIFKDVSLSYDKKNKINLFYELASSEKRTLQKGSLEFDPNLLPDKLSMNPAFPNPFNPVTTLRFDIPETINSNFVLLNIYDIKGRMVKKLAEGSMLPGKHQLRWDASHFSSGVYFVKLTYDNQNRTQKLILLK